ncbi:thiamine biosynthesis protein ThiS (plasmid) [Candidatus Pantoea edessiphila]|uniref:Thiamine biosynthesis protein ThiS n=1 Tax=Candidatus Pantoea edessiphila TaxID=2044610 RepID=A0A2P5SZ66_9GAMM|nr:sulfur carrier protein ThiS [Candidatus Pantoea edessiphila]PPI87631.1 thiamine biosynthesis protein ThiS [Candidatus Pantoea edessiphila]
MKININDNIIELLSPIFLSELIVQQYGNINGIAIAVNQKIIPNCKWANYLIQDKDNIIIFQAIAGG